MRRDAFLHVQREQFDRVDEMRFFWQTQNPMFSQTERELLRGIFGHPRRFLEVGCGEGGNLVNGLAIESGPMEVSVGVDLFYKKLRFASERVPQCRFLCADAHALPFANGTFDTILCRDILHHVEDPSRVVAELARLCTPSGRVVYLEPNRRNPLMAAQAAVHPFERGILHHSVRGLWELVSRHFTSLKLEYRHPLPISRVLLHYRFGLPNLGHLHWVGALLRRVEGVAAHVVPVPWWSYLCITASGPRTPGVS